MIKSKADLRYYLQEDAKAFGKTKPAQLYSEMKCTIMFGLFVTTNIT